MPPTEGRILFKGHRYKHADRAAARQQAAKLKVQMIFQDPMASLNPRLRVTDIVGEAPLVHGLVTRAKRDDYVADMLRRVGLDPSVSCNRYPHQFSGGQRARPSALHAPLRCSLKFLICAMNPSLHSHCFNSGASAQSFFFSACQAKNDLTYASFISHDLGVVAAYLRPRRDHVSRAHRRACADRSAVRPLRTILTRRALCQRAAARCAQQRFGTIKGEIPSPLAPPPGCPFHPRCPHAERCSTERAGAEGDRAGADFRLPSE